MSAPAEPDFRAVLEQIIASARAQAKAAQVQGEAMRSHLPAPSLPALETALARVRAFTTALDRLSKLMLDFHALSESDPAAAEAFLARFAALGEREFAMFIAGRGAGERKSASH